MAYKKAGVDNSVNIYVSMKGQLQQNTSLM